MRTQLIFHICFFFWSLCVASGAQRQSGFTVVLDPGHGGADHGTVYKERGGSISEKEITLLIAQEVAKKLRARGVQVILTRNGDKEVSLKDRTALANKVGASLFLSIHMNSTSEKGAKAAISEGIETFILNNTTDDSSKRLAHFENSVLGPNEGVDNLDVALILKDLRLDANLSESKRFACGLQDSLIKATAQLRYPGIPLLGSGSRISIRNRGVRQALFFVLLGADMPSALVEAGFLSNPRDRAIVVSPQGRNTIAGAMARAIDDFRKTKGSQEASVMLSRCKVH